MLLRGSDDLSCKGSLKPGIVLGQTGNGTNGRDSRSRLKFPLVSSEFFLLREALGVSFGLRFLSTTLSAG